MQRLAPQLTASLFVLATISCCLAQSDGPASGGLRAGWLAHMDPLIEAALANEQLPGCVVCVGRRGGIVLEKAYGFRALLPEKVPMTRDTVFDLASLTKPIATATCILQLVEQGKLRLRDRATVLLPEFANHGKERITLEQLLTHQAGLIADNPLADYRQGRKQAIANICKLETTYPPGTRFVYSDVGFVVLGELVRRASGVPLDEFARRELFEPLRMRETTFRPGEELRHRAAPTEKRDDQWIQGEVHDPRSHRMGGVAGHAGLFSTARDLARYAQMLLGGGALEGVRVLSPAGVARMTRSVRIVEGEKVSVRALGWDKLSGYSSNRGELCSAEAFGHGGFTGTAIWIDPTHDLFVIFLSNRVHPNGQGKVNRLAGQIGTVAVAALTDTSSPSTSAN